MYHQSWSSTLKVQLEQLEVVRTQFSSPGLVVFWGIFFFKKKSEIWSIYGRSDAIALNFLKKLHWLFHVGFGEIRFLKWHDVSIQSLGFWQYQKLSGLPLFQLINLINIYFLKIKQDFNKNWYFMCQILTPEC